MLHNLHGDSTAAPHEQLPDREFQVLRLIATGKSSTEISADLALSPKTVSTHKSRILEKMHMSHRAEFIRYAIERKPVDAPRLLLPQFSRRR